jgi:hypothetical protein
MSEPIRDMHDFKITIWMHTSMTQQEVESSIEETLPTASYLVEDQNTTYIHMVDKRRPPKVALYPGSKTVEVRDNLL